MTDTARFDQPPATVFEALTDPEDLAAWHHGFDHAERLDDGPLRVGSRIRAESRVDGRPATVDLEVVALDPPRRIELVASSDDVSSRAILTVRAVDGGSEVTATSAAAIDDADDGRAVEPAANPAFADLGASLLAGLRTALADRPVEPR